MKKMLMALLLVSGSLIAKDYALIVGVSKYKDSTVPKLNIENDIAHYENILTKMNFKDEIEYFRNEHATRENILDYIKRTTKKIQSNDRFFMFFTGHGTDYQDEDYGSKLQTTLAEKYWLDTGMILPYDFNPQKNKIANSVIIGKRDLRKYFAEIDKKTDKAFIVFDACFSENSSKGKNKQIHRFVHLDTKNQTYPYKNIVYIGASKTQARTGKLSKVLDDCIQKGINFRGLKSCMNAELSKSPHVAVVLSGSDKPMIFEKNGYLALGAK